MKTYQGINLQLVEEETQLANKNKSGTYLLLILEIVTKATVGSCLYSIDWGSLRVRQHQTLVIMEK